MHNIVEFYHKTTFLQSVEVCWVGLKENFSKYEDFYDYKKTVKKFNQTGIYKLAFKKTSENKHKVNMIIENLKQNSLRGILTDAICYHTGYKFGGVQLKSIGTSNFVEEQSSSLIILNGYYHKLTFST